MKKIGTFDIEESFNITEWGIVITGYCNDCVPKVGLFISIVIQDKIEVFKIVGISLGNNPKNDKDKFGLLIQTTSGMLKYIFENKIINHVGNILAG